MEKSRMRIRTGVKERDQQLLDLHIGQERGRPQDNGGVRERLPRWDVMLGCHAGMQCRKAMPECNSGMPDAELQCSAEV